MKTRFITLSALAVAAIAFFGCNKAETPIDTPNETKGIPFEFTASEIVTRTTFDGTHTNWKSTDKVNLFHAEAGSTSYTSDGAFTASADGRDVTFTGTLASALTAANYDWYAIYPYDSHIITPASTSDGYLTLGSASSGKQKQTGNSDMTHIAGDKYPVAGKALDVAKDTKPVITMSHLTSVIAVKVTNGLTSPITVSEVAFTGTERINGTFYIDFVSDPVVYTSSGDSYTSNTATLQVASGTPIAAGGNATFYMAVKPFEAPASSTLSVSVTADNGTQVFNKVIGSAANFQAGKINTLNVEYDQELVLSLPFEDNMSWADSGTESDGGALSSSNFPTTLGGDPMYASVNTAYKGPGAIKLGTGSLRGDITTVNLDLSSSYTIIVSAKTWGTDESNLQVFVDGVQVGADAALYNEFVEYVYKRGAATSSSNVKVKVDGKRGYINSIRIVSGTDYTAKPVIHLTSTPDELTAAAGSSTIGYVVLNPTTASVSAAAEADWVNTFNYSVANTVGFSYTENTGALRSQDITLSYTGADNKVVTVTQAAAGPSMQTLYLETFGNNGGSNTAVADATCYTAEQTMFTDPTTTVVSHYSSEGKVGKNTVNPSEGYSGASGNSAVWYTGAGKTTTTVNLFTVDRIDISGATSINVSFGLFHTNAAGTTGTVYYKIDSGEEQTLSFTEPDSNNTWTLCSGSISGTGSSLKLRFVQETTGGYTGRMDDLKVVGTK